MPEDFKTKQKIYDMMLYAYPALAQFPKSERYALAADVKHSMHVLYALSIAFREKVLADYVLIRDSSKVEISETEGVFTRE